MDFGSKAKGAAGLATARTKKFLGILKHGSEWRNFEVPSPSGGNIQLFFNRDRSPMQAAVEFGAKKLKAVVAEVVVLAGGASKQIGLNKPEGQVSVNWHPVVKVICREKNCFELRWYLPGCDAAGIRDDIKKDIHAKFTAATGRVPREQWSI